MNQQSNHSTRFRIIVALLGAPICVALSPRAHAMDFSRGDADNNGSREITDAILVLNFLFTGGKAPACVPVGDANGDGTLNLSDAIFLLGHLFLGGPAPPPLTAADLQTCAGVDPEAIARGLKEYEIADTDGNLFACSLCHSMAPTESSEVLRPGYTLHNSLSRPSFKEGSRSSYVGAVNVCRQDWMGVLDPVSNDYTPWTENTPRFKDLVAFIDSLSDPGPAPALQYEIVAPARTGPATGNANAGCLLFNRSCRTCHGVGGSGNDLGVTLLDVVSPCSDKPDPCLSFLCEPKLEDCLDNPDYLRARIRLSGPIGQDQVYQLPPGHEFIGSAMPFWTKDKLSDDAVEDIVTFLLGARQAIREGNPPIACVSSPSPDGTPLHRGTFGAGTHGVEGTVEVLDTQRLRFTNLSYDGGGIEVRAWISKASVAESGRAVGPDLFGLGMKNATFVIELPADVVVGSFDTVALRCVTAKVNLASASLSTVP